MKDREQVIQELENIIDQLFDKESDEFYSHKVADWHLAEVARILEPLREAINNSDFPKMSDRLQSTVMFNAINSILEG